MPQPPSSDASTSTRLDLWLWAVRLFKTRPLAAIACDRGQVLVNGREGKASRQIRRGIVLSIERDGYDQTVEVVAPLTKRVGAKVVAEYCVDITSAEERAKAERRAQERSLERRSYRPPEVRPNKKQLRDLKKFLQDAE